MTRYHTECRKQREDGAVRKGLRLAKKVTFSPEHLGSATRHTCPLGMRMPHTTQHCTGRGQELDLLCCDLLTGACPTTTEVRLL